MARLLSGDSKVGTNTNTIDSDKVAIEPELLGGAAHMDGMDLDIQVHGRVLRKLDWHLLPFVTLLYLLSYLDRANIGNARIAGMATDLELVGLRYNIAAAIFFVPYSLTQAPSNVLLKLFRPSRWIPVIMVTWGLIMTLMCLVKTYHQLLIARFFLGLAEAGLLPGVTYYISSWYPRVERAKRIAIFVSAASMGGAFGGLLAYAIEKMEGIGGLHGWQWIFCLEGLATVLIAFATSFLIYDCPETASFLTEAERRYVVELMKADSQGLATHYNFRFVLQGFKDYRVYLQFGVMIGFAVPGYAIALFTPTIINELGFSAADAQLLSVLPFTAGCIATVLIGIHSDRCRLRGPYVVACALMGLAGCITLYTQARPGAALVGVVLTTMGIFPAAPLVLTWTSSNAGGDMKRGVAIGIVSGLANTGAICSSFIFFDPPRFHTSLGISMCLLSYSMLTCLFTMWNYNRMNKQKEKWCNEHGITDEREDEFRESGDDSPLFRYTL